MRWDTCSCLAIICLFAGRTACGQTIAAPALQLTPATSTADAVEVEAAASASAKDPAAAESTPDGQSDEGQTNEVQELETLRLSKFKEQTFDRRPSAILKLWFEQQKKAGQKEDEKANDKEDSGDKSDDPAEERKANKEEATEQNKQDAEDGKKAKAKPPVEDLTKDTSGSGDPEQDEASKKAAEEAARQQALNEQVDKELEQLQRDVTLGHWDAVKQYLAQFSPQPGKEAYQHLLTSLAAPAQDGQQQAQLQMAIQSLPPMMRELAMQAQRHDEKSVFSLDDVLSLADAAPAEALEETTLPLLARIVRLSLDQGHAVEMLVEMLQRQSGDAEDSVLTRRQAARLLIAAGQAIHAAVLLPTAEEATEQNDREALHLLAHCFLAKHAEENKREHLDSAWRAVQGALVGDELSESDRQQTLQQAVSLAPQISPDLGQKWLAESFTSQPHRGAEILATIGAAVAQGARRYPSQPEQRLAGLKLQHDAVKALLKTAPKNLDDWREALTLLAENWVREAELSYQLSSSSSLGPRMQFDMYGNSYFIDPDSGSMMNYSGRRVQAIDVGDVLEVRPDEPWRDLLDASLKPGLASLQARLYLKVNEEAEAFPHIERLAATHPERATELGDEFLRVWARNHDPNSQNQRRGVLWMYGYQPRAEGIPLTRSKQERNLRELETWVVRLRELPIGELDQDLLAEAFTQSHSTAEVYRLEAIERVFGSLDDTNPNTLGSLAQKMRSNLAGVWRAPAVQEQLKTNRKKQDLEAEVRRGYEVAHRVVDRGLERHPDHWRLRLAKAALLHDENNYHRELNPDHSFADNRRAALAMFGRAAELYAAELPEMEPDDHTTDVFDLWFYASLGACELADISEENRLDESQPPLIRQALLALPEQAAQEHLDLFANRLFQRLTGAKPQVKYRYLQAGLEIVGDHPQAHEARKLLTYYADLVTEIKLEATIDGSDNVGHAEPFGVFVDIRHTKEIERESGGFGKYLQNQTSMYYAYNYGRPLADYRDRFEKAARAALEEHFDVLSITFQDEGVQSRADEPYGWRVTPYAYLLLQPHGPEVDKLPPLSIDVDFIDTSGYVILPIESPAVPLDCSSAGGEPRPAENIKIVETLDERRADEGTLILELKATGNGLVPPLEELLELNFAGFEVTKTDKQPVAVARFDPDQRENVVVSERISTLTMRASSDERPELFQFAAAKPTAPELELTYQRYDDADMVQAERQIQLEESYADSSGWWKWIWPGVIGIVLLGAIAIGVALRPRQVKDEAAAFRVPETLTPFTVLGLLTDIQQNNGLDSRGRQELSATIDRIESRYYAGRDGDGEVDLREIADSWVRRASRRG